MGMPALLGTQPASFFPLHELFPPVRLRESEAPPDVIGRRGRDKANFAANREQAVQERFEMLVYRAQTIQVSFAGRVQEVAAGFAGDGGEAALSLQARQLEFSFFAETRTEELIRYSGRTQRAAKGHGGKLRDSYIETSRGVATRFSASLSISGAALSGYASLSEGLADAGALFEQFTSLAKGLLERADDLFSEVLSLFAGGGLLGAGEAHYADIFGGLFAAVQAQFVSFANAALPAPAAGRAQAGFTQLEFKFSFEMEITVAQTEVQESDPIILDLDGDGFELSSYANGARFDILGNGQKQNTAFVQGGDAFLALDRNGDGVINSGKELFGDQHGAANGFEELRKLDSNQDGVIDRRDRDFAKLLLFKDNGNGKTEAGELLGLEEAGITSLSLGYADTDQRAAGGNRITQIASFQRSDGTLGRTADAVLNYTI